MLAPQLGHKKGKTQACPDPHAEAESAKGHTSVQTMKGGSLWRRDGRSSWDTMTGAPSQLPAFAVTLETAGVLGGAQQLSGGGQGNFESVGPGNGMFLERVEHI